MSEAQNQFPPMRRSAAIKRGWLPKNPKQFDEQKHGVDFVLVTGDAYVDHPSFANAVITRLLESKDIELRSLPSQAGNRRMTFRFRRSSNCLAGVRWKRFMLNNIRPTNEFARTINTHRCRWIAPRLRNRRLRPTLSPSRKACPNHQRRSRNLHASFGSLRLLARQSEALDDSRCSL